MTTARRYLYLVLLLTFFMFGTANAGPAPEEKPKPPAAPTASETPPPPAKPSLTPEEIEDLIYRGDEFYRIRGVNHMKDRAIPAYVSTALDLYLKAYAAGKPSEDLIIRILQASYYYVTYAEKDKKLRREAVDRAMEIGQKGLEAYPESAAMNYWMAALWGSWSKLHGRFAAAKKDVALKIRALAEKTIELDPEYNEGGGYRTLGRLHFKTPRIPFLITWPDKKKALELLKKAVEVGPKNLTNHLFYAEALLYSGKRAEARKEITLIQKADVREDRVVEDLRVKKEAADLLLTLNEKIDPAMTRRTYIP